jgi:hypothetical protein
VLFDRSPIIKSQRQTPLWCHKSMFAWICTNLTNYQVSFITTSIASYQALQIPGLQFTPRRKWLQHQVSLCFNCQGQVHPAKLESDCWENEKTRLLYLNKNPLSGICWDYLDHKMGQSLWFDTTRQRHIMVNWTPENGLRIYRKLKLDLLLPQHFLCLLM